MLRHVLMTAAIAVLAAALPAQAQTADDYPSKPIKIVVAAGAGGPTDVPARIASQILTAKFGQPVVVENRPGAGGVLGARAVATAPADGYTLLMGNTSVMAVIPAVSAGAGYDPVKDFVPIVKMTEGFQILVVHPASSWKTLKEFVDHAKAHPSKLNYAHTGNGGLPHLAGELFMLRSGAKMTGVSYRSGGESNTAVLGQTVDATFENIAILRTLITEGRLRALAVQNAARTPLLPELPTMAEVGLADCEANTFYGLAAPAGTPASIVAKLNAAINEAMATPEMQRTITSLGSESKPNTPAEFAAFIAAQHKKWLDVGNAAGVKVN